MNFIGDQIISNPGNYLYTNIISYILFKAFKTDCVVYPSVKSNLKSNNLALTPEAANKYIVSALSHGISHDKTRLFDIMTYKK